MNKLYYFGGRMVARPEGKDPERHHKAKYHQPTKHKGMTMKIAFVGDTIKAVGDTIK